MAQQRQPSKADMIKQISVGLLVNESKPSKREDVRGWSKFLGFFVGAPMGTALGPLLAANFMAADFDQFGRNLIKAARTGDPLGGLVATGLLLVHIVKNVLILAASPLIGLVHGIMAGVKGGLASAINPLAILHTWRATLMNFADGDSDFIEADAIKNESLRVEQLVFGIGMTAGIAMGIGVGFGANPFTIIGIGALLKTMLGVVGVSALAGPVGVLAIVGAMTVVSLVLYIGLKILKPFIIDKLAEKFADKPEEEPQAPAPGQPEEGPADQPEAQPAQMANLLAEEADQEGVPLLEAPEGGPVAAGAGDAFGGPLAPAEGNDRQQQAAADNPYNAPQVPYGGS